MVDCCRPLGVDVANSASQGVSHQEALYQDLNVNVNMMKQGNRPPIKPAAASLQKNNSASSYQQTPRSSVGDRKLISIVIRHGREANYAV